MAPIDPSRHYTIQNVDFMSCLEMTVRPVNKPVSARPWKDSDKQKWKFVLVSGSEDEYYIYNNAQKTYLGIASESDRRLCSKSRSNASRWLLYPLKSIQGALTFEVVLAGEESDTCLELGEFGNPHIADREESEAQQWRIFRGSPVSSILTHSVTLAAGYYRIRNLDGHSILSLPDSEPVEGPTDYTGAYITEQDSDNDHQRFFVKPKADDERQFSIQSGANRGEYLGVDSTQHVRFGLVRGLPHEFFWEVESIGGFAYALRVKSVQGDLSPGFISQLQNDASGRVILLPSNSNHSQAWLFERWDKIPEEVSSTGSNPTPSRSYGGSRTFLDTNGWYNLCSVAFPTSFLHLHGVYGGPHIVPLDVSYYKTYGSFHFVWKGRYFQIRDRCSTPYYAFATAAHTTLQRTQTVAEASWWYLKYDKSKEAYNICLHEPTRKRSEGVRALSCNGNNTSSNFYYNIPLTILGPGASNVLWTIQ
ncbi:hypothetical protein D9611_001754 [Ephemerocybe angulata]|uniref:Ricin B lectin domain-containing protein n=1 Tax=Ephemerocybe angulata TaxID=980116 RepID=A0A8H5FMY7_9AGAR|nr:hypothetical protein D9611_001754 [Tulosesus angulatus]